MAYVSVSSPLEWPYGLMDRAALTAISGTMDAAGEYFSAITVAPKTGNIHKIGFGTGTVTSAQTLDARIETVDGSGNASGTLFGTNTNGSQASPASNTWYWVTLTADAAVTMGDVFAIAIKWAGSAGSLVINYSLRGTHISAAGGMPYSGGNTGSTFKDANNAPALAIEYSDGTRTHCGTFPYSSTTVSQNINTGTTPDEAGALFQVPFACKVNGALVKASASATTFAVKLYDADGSTVLASKTAIDSEWESGAGGARRVLFSSEITLAAATSYRLTILPEAATNVTVYSVTVDSAGTLEAWPGGANFYWTQRTDGGAWTDTNTKIPQVALLISSLADGASSGGGGLSWWGA